MKKVGKSAKVYFIGMLIGGIALGVSTVIADTIINSTSVAYKTTTVKAALDNLYDRSDTWLNPNDMGTPKYYAYGQYKGWCSSSDTNCNSYADFPTTSTTPPSGKNVYAVKYEDGQYGVCIQRNGKEHCFRGRNYKAEAKHVQEVFSDISCRVYSSYVACLASDFTCGVYSNGRVDCYDSGTSGTCYVYSGGSVNCS